jgi:2-ketoarginine methyltransferase
VALTEDRLVRGLQPIRNFVLAQAIFHFMELGLLDAVAAANRIPIAVLARSRGLREDRLRGLLRYLANEELVGLDADDGVSLTERGRELVAVRPWYTLLVGGYLPAFAQLSEVMKNGAGYASRDGGHVGEGSCGISQHDALPMTRRLIDRLDQPPGTIVDLGCGDGSYLLDLCRQLPGVHGLGVDPEPESVAAAREKATQQGLGDRVSLYVGSAASVPDLGGLRGPLCFITAFVLQEVLEQSGRDAVLDLLQKSFTAHPDAKWIVIEVDHRPDDDAVMGHGLGLAYYNPYYLIHKVTEQRLEPVRFWEELYREAGLSVLAMEYPDSRYDSLGLKVGFLLSRA